MVLQNKMERYIETIFCDDIRHEVNGKISFIGVYSGKLFVHDFPITLPKLCLDIKIRTPIDLPFEELTISVFKDDEVLEEIIIDKEQCKEANEAINNGSDEFRVLSAAFQLIFSPIEFERPCKLRVRAQTESEEIKGLALQIEKIPQKQAKKAAKSNK